MMDSDRCDASGLADQCAWGWASDAWWMERGHVADRSRSYIIVRSVTSAKTISASSVGSAIEAAIVAAELQSTSR